MTHDVSMAIDYTRFSEIYPFALRTIDKPLTTVARTEAPTDGEIVAAIVDGLSRRPCVGELDSAGTPTGHMLVPSQAELNAISHFLLPTVRRLVTGRDVDEFDFLCGGSCGEETCQRG